MQEVERCATCIPFRYQPLEHVFYLSLSWYGKSVGESFTAGCQFVEGTSKAWVEKFGQKARKAKERPSCLQFQKNEKDGS